MTDEHFENLERFWTNVMKEMPDSGNTRDSSKAEAALILPNNYGWGMRHLDDKIWYWGPDEKSPQIWNLSRTLLDQYGTRLDIIYDDPDFPFEGVYPKVYYWNYTG
jgi:hypothetical protein